MVDQAELTVNDSWLVFLVAEASASVGSHRCPAEPVDFHEARALLPLAYPTRAPTRSRPLEQGNENGLCPHHPTPTKETTPVPTTAPRRVPLRRAATALLAAACVAGLIAGQSTASAVPSPSGTGDTVSSTHTVTLVTGETVTLLRFADGRQAATVEPAADGTEASFRTLQVDKSLYVIPGQAEAYLAGGQLDRELFNISKLVEYRFDDAHRSSIPVIATYTGAAAKSESALADVETPDGATRTRLLPSADAIALAAAKKSSRTFWRSLGGSTTTASAKPRLAGGIGKLWLDRPVKVTLDRSVPQIGAPAAWAAGYDGTGVKVAVLDTGIDLTHPDVAQVKEAKNFTTDADAVDHHGHGTHVASTIAGSGAAADGKYKGVAPGADLLIGKVLDNKGSGDTSWIIAGMQWAVDQGADVVSMSLGSNQPSDGTDPMAQAVNSLSDSSGALFVIAAGNAGPGKTTIGTPGSADAALTVGAVDKSDQLASFSSRGPRLGDSAVKPEITAPGVNIVAARAAGTTMGTPVDTDYTSANGTSMATPHVAGAVAILKQRHQDWTGDRLKQVLISSADRSKPFTAYQQGGGRVDVAKAIDASFYSSPAVVSAGSVPPTGAPVEKSVGYVNTSDSDVTLSLTLTATTETGAAAPAGMFALGAAGVTVPAGSRAEVPVTFDPDGGAPSGDYNAVVTASAGDGSVARTTIGATQKVPPNLTVNLIGRDGGPGASFTSVDALNIDTGQYFTNYAKNGTLALAVPPGRYSVMAFIYTNQPGVVNLSDATLGGEPETEVSGNTTITIDARQGREIKFNTPQESESHGYKLGYGREAANGRGVSNVVNMTSPIWDHPYMIPTARVTTGEFDVISSERRYAPVIRATYGDRHGAALPLEQVIMAARLNGNRTLEAVSVGTAASEDLKGRKLNGRIAVITRDLGVPLADQIEATADAGAEAAIVVIPPGPQSAIIPGPIRQTGTTIPAWSITNGPGGDLIARIAAGRTMINVRGIPNSPFVYNIIRDWPGQIPAHPAVTVTRNNSHIVRADYHGSTGSLVGDTNPWFTPKDLVTIDAQDWFLAPSRRQEWYSAGDNAGRPLSHFAWTHVVGRNGGRALLDQRRAHTPGTTAEDSWWGAANGPSGPEAATAYREGDNLMLRLPNMGDSGSGHYGWVSRSGGGTETAKAYRDGQQIYTGDEFTGRAIATTPGQATYRLTMDSAHNGSWFPLATSASTAWTLTSAHVDSGRQALPLLWPRYDLRLGDDNTTSDNGTYHFPLSILSQTGADTTDVKGVELSYSTDDGATWQPSKVKAEHGGYDATVRNPDSGFVSLRVKAWDTDGNQVEQTLIRAYAVR